MRTRAVLLVLAVLLAGCAGAVTTERPVGPDAAVTPSPDGTAVDAGTPVDGTPTPEDPAPTETPVDKVSTSGQNLSFDEETVYRDVVDMHGRSYAGAPDVELTVKPEPTSARTGSVISTTPFLRLWEFNASRVNATGIAGLAIGGEVYLYTNAVNSTTTRKTVLAHEYTHVLQSYEGAFVQVQDAVGQGDGNRQLLYTATIEGSASYAEAYYARHYLEEPQPEQSWAEYSGNRSRLGAYLVAPYYFGERYVEGRVDSPANLSTVYENPPLTTEQLIHGYGPDEEPARSLNVSAGTAEDTDWITSTPRTRGELVVRLVLEGRLDRDRAASAAAGWGADRLVRFDHPDRSSGFAWVLRWDAPSEADEFETAMTAYLDARADRTDGRWTDDGTAFDVRRVSDETVVVVAGPSAFVENATADGGDGNVTVNVGG